MFTTYLTLLIAHFIGDFPLQSGKIYDLKIKSSPGLFLHTLIHAGVSMFLIKNAIRWWWVFVLLILVHFAIDWFKLRVDTKPQWIGYLIDQFVHWISLAGLVLLAPEMKSALPEEWILFDLFLILIPLFVVLIWIFIFDKYPKQDTTPRKLIWIKQKGLLVSQVIGMLATFLILIQVLGN